MIYEPNEFQKNKIQILEKVAVYIHELLHQFGGDSSGQFRAAILAMDYRILEKAEKIEDYEREWNLSFTLSALPVSIAKSDHL